MKKHIATLICFLFVGLESCYHQGGTYYVYTTVGDELRKEKFQAENDTLACQWAADHFESEVLDICSTINESNASSIKNRIPSKYLVTRKTGREIRISGIVPKFISENELIAFGDSEFGMSVEDVLSLEPFKQWKRRKSSLGIRTPTWITYPVEVLEGDLHFAGHNYDASLLFNDKGLFRVVLTSNELAGTTDIDYCREQINDFYLTVFKKYGPPDLNNSYYGLDTGKNVIYKWNLGDKVIEASIYKYLGGRVYPMLRIYSKQKEADIDAFFNVETEKYYTQKNEQLETSAGLI